MYPFYGGSAFVLWILAVCWDDSCARNFFALGEHDEAMSIFPLFVLLIRCLVLLFIVVSIKYLCFGQKFPEFNLTHLLLSTEVHHSKVDIHFGDAQQECKDTIWPVFCAPNNLQTNTFIVVIINRVLVQKMISHNLRVVECLLLLHATPIHPFMTCFLSSS